MLTSFEWETLVDNLQQQKCALILGPELINYGDKTFFDLLCDELKKEPVPLVRHFFTNDELVQFDRNVVGYEMRMYQFLDRFYRKRTEFDAVMEKVVALPFPAFISLLPDSRLTDAFEKADIDHQSARYPRDQNPEPVELPTRQCPLVYHLLGTLRGCNTVLTFDDLFEYLKGILGARELPINLQVFLRDVSCFVFLGVRFEKWYMQILLKLLMNNRYSLRYASSKVLREDQREEIRTFVSSRLDLVFVDEEPTSFLDELYNQCAARNLLRKSPQTVAEEPPVRVFISYSYRDDAQVLLLRDALQKAGMEVIIGQEAISSGQDINDFIRQSVRNSDCTLSIVSENSLLSAWVARESAASLQEAEGGRLVIPCYLESSFLERDATDRVLKKIEEEIRDIGNRIQERTMLRRPINDLLSLYNLYYDHQQEIVDYITMLRNSACVDLTTGKFDAGVQKLVNDIKTFASRRTHEQAGATPKEPVSGY